VQYPTQATPRRSSLSRVPENGTHGLKGDAMETGQPRWYRAIIYQWIGLLGMSRSGDLSAAGPQLALQALEVIESKSLWQPDL